jgi:thioredoxin reductase
MNDFDVVIVGGGAAGLSAALVLSRARRAVLVIDSGTPRNAPAAHMHGYLSRDGLSPSALLSVGRDEIGRYGTIVVDGAVTEVIPDGNTGLWVVMLDGKRISTRRVLVATGLRDVLPDIAGLSKRWAKDVLHCPYCHGWEVRDQPLGVLGRSSENVRYAQIVRQWSDDVVYFAQPRTLTAVDRSQLVARAIEIVEGIIKQVLVDENDQLCGVAMDDGRTIARRALFVPPRLVPNGDLVAGLGCDVDENGWVTVDPTGRTSVQRVWAAGNVANPRAQVITAAGEGSAAAIAINADLVEEDVDIAVRHFDRGTTRTG